VGKAGAPENKPVRYGVDSGRSALFARASVAALLALAVSRAAKSQDASSKRIETATKRLATFTMWLMIATGVLAAATIALVFATASSR
jgi:hypothetical protein